MGAVHGKVAIVTGASSGIGRATAQLFAREGARVVLSGRRKDVLDRIAAELGENGGEAIAVAGDVRDEAVARALVDAASSRFGGLDIAFNNAGDVGTMGPAIQLSLADWRATIDTNLTAAFLAAKYQIPALLERSGGSIIFTGSFVGHTVGFPGMAAYAAAKAGLIGLTQVLATEFGARGVRVNTILPGGTDTPSNAANLPGAAPETRAFIAGLHALKRLGRPEEIAQAALYLASDASSFVTGTALTVDGGVSITRT
jgi:NAD(P)-dependent dehydrogenase (short-subunit alcohol dehydrogenase family)